MKLPSIELLLNSAKETLIRFPFVLLWTFIGSGSLIIALNFDVFDRYSLLNLGVTSIFGLILMYCIEMFTERFQRNETTKWLIRGVGNVALIVLFFLLPSESYSLKLVVRLFVIWLGLHLVSSYAPFFMLNDKNGFWHYNQILFIRLLTALLYSTVLFGGLSLALLAIDALFNVSINSKNYVRLSILIYGIFNTWYFLAGIPKDFNELTKHTAYPKELKVFTQYVLLPLVVIYLVILYAYSGKIVFTWDLPKGWVSYLVLIFSILGIFALLLIEPVKNDAQNTWIKIFSKTFYIALFPLIILLFVAIGYRVSSYGITENRYFVLILALWLAGIALYFLISKEKSIKTIPLTLSVLTIVSVSGPWGAFQVSERSQKGIFEKCIKEQNLLNESGKIAAANKIVPDTVMGRISRVADYFEDRKNLSALSDYFSVHDTLYTSRKVYNKAEKLFESSGLKYYSPYYNSVSKSGKQFYYNMYFDGPYEITGYDYLKDLNLYFSNEYNDGQEIDAKNELIKIKLVKNMLVFEVYDKVRKTKVEEFISIDKEIRVLAETFPGGKSFSGLTDNMIWTLNLKAGYNIKIIIDRMNLKEEEKIMYVEDMGGQMLVGLVKKENKTLSKKNK